MVRSTCYYLFLLTASLMYAQTSYTISDDVDQHIFVYDFIQYLKNDDLTFEEIVKLPDSAFTENKDFAPSYTSLNTSFWIKIKINHSSNSSEKWLLEFFDQTIDQITAYIPDKRENYKVLKLGDKQNYGFRSIKHKNFVIPIENDHDRTLTYYFHIKSANTADLLLVLRSYKFFTFYSLNEYFLFGLFYGLIILIALYNLLLFFAVQDKTYLYFVLYTISVAFYFASADGFAYQYVWPYATNWNDIAKGVFIFLMTAFGIVMSRSFLHLPRKAPIVDRVLILFVIIRSGYFVTCFAFFPTLFDDLQADLISLILLLVIAIRFLRRGYQPARLFSLAFTFLFLGAMIRVLVTTGIGNIGSGVINYYSLNIGFLLQLITLSLALGDKVRILKSKKDRAMKRVVAQHEINKKLQTKVNRELELKVKERTIALDARNEELNEANLKLEQQKQEINTINSELDRINWKLKKETGVELRKTALTQVLSYVDFMKIFPDQISCYEYLANQKWKEGFICKKCNYDGFSNETKCGKRCKRCGYLESATSNTVFHNLRFPIGKALYIYHVTMSNAKVTAKELSQLIDLREGTCSSFIRKIKNLSDADRRISFKKVFEDTK